MSENKVIIIGGGGHAKALMDSIFSAAFYKIEGILDASIRAGEKVLGVPVLGGDELLDRYINFKDKLFLALGVGAIKAGNRRKAIYERNKKRGFRFATVIHDKAYTAGSARINQGAQIMAGVTIGSDVKIGENTVVYSNCVVEHDSIIAPHAYLSPGVLLGGGVRIGEASFIGIGAKISQNVKIGRSATVGAGAVVIKDVEDGTVVAGIPAKEIRK